jgi:hypothetical protein
MVVKRGRDAHGGDLLLAHGGCDDLVHPGAEVRGGASLSGRGNGCGK